MGFDWIAPKNYKRHYICLNCQKGFKRPSKEDMKHPKSLDFVNLMDKYYELDIQQNILEYINEAHQKINVICPNCQGLMQQVHYNFEVPSHRNSKAWKILQKTMAFDNTINYNIYIKWHITVLKEGVKDPDKLESIKRNLETLNNVSKDNKE